jgi:hypothetical protein
MSIDKLYMKTDEDLRIISDKKQILTTYEKLFKLRVSCNYLNCLFRIHELPKTGANFGFSAKSIASGHFMDNRTQN